MVDTEAPSDLMDLLPTCGESSKKSPHLSARLGSASAAETSLSHARVRAHLEIERGGGAKAQSFGPDVGHSDGKYSLWSSLKGWPVSQFDFLSVNSASCP